MTSVLHYGVDSEVRLELPPGVLVAECGGNAAGKLDDVAATLDSALHAPLEFPPLAQAAVPGDTVVIAIDQGVPQAAALMPPVVRTLVELGVPPRNIAILLPQNGRRAPREDPRCMLADRLRGEVGFLTHDARNRDQLAYLAATRDGRPIYLNRAMLDADLVLPIGCTRCASTPGYLGVLGGIYPTFADAAAQGRVGAATAGELDIPARRQAWREVEEVGWLLGVQFAVQVVPGRAGTVGHVVAGQIDAVARRSTQLCDAAWSYHVPRRASLVIAAIEGQRAEQTWDNVGRALAAASRAVEDDGSIAICCDLDEAPGPGVAQCAGADDLRVVYRRIVHDAPADTLPAAQLALALARTRVYLLSRLDESTVEELGMAPVSSAAEIARLAGRHPSCILLANAQHTVATLDS